jgi:hypothetical protein
VNTIWADVKHLDRPVRAVVVLWLLALLAMVLLRALPGFMPYTAETDWKQWLWLYHRYSTPGAFPSGQLLTDYALSVQPPLFFAVCAGLSWLIGPVPTAVFLYALAMGAAAHCAWWAARARVSPVAALLAALIVLHGYAYFKHAAGGYPRTFGPTLTLWCLAAWMNGRHRQVLLSLLVMGGVYPSVLVPCGLGYGAWSVLFAGRAGFWRRNVLLAAVGVLSVLLAQLQSLRVPDWYGHVVTLKEALAMPALGKLGRTWWVPMPGYWEKVSDYLFQPLRASGALPLLKLWPHAALAAYLLWGLVIGLLLLATYKLSAPAGDASASRRDRILGRIGAMGHSMRTLVPLEPVLMLAGALLAFVLARALAFKLYLPHRVVQHVLPYVLAVAIAIIVGRALAALLSDRRLLWATALWAPLTFLAVAGDGMFAGAFRSYADDKALYQWVEQHTPVQAQFAGTLRVLDEIPFFSKRQAFVNWKMAHPFRLGFYQEIERRVVAMYDAYYATDLSAVLAFCQQEHIDYFIVDDRRFEEVEQGDGNLFEPLRGRVARLFLARRASGFALEHVPEAAVVFRHQHYRVIDVTALRRLHGGEQPTASDR